MKIDLYGPASFSAGHPFEQYRWLRENDPVHRHAEPGGPGFWALTRHAEVWETDRNWNVFSSEGTIAIRDPDPAEAAMFGDHKMMLMMDPPQHTLYRRLLRETFQPGPSAAMAPWMARLATAIVDAVIERGECDFVSEVAGEMPSLVIAELMGLPAQDGRELYHLTETIHTAPEALPPGAQAEAMMRMFDYGRGVIAEKRARPGDDLATKLLNAEVDGKRLDDIDFLLFFLLLIDAGGDTTRNLLSAGLIALIDNPDQHAWLMADLDARLPAAQEELLRWCSPVVYMRRTAKIDTQIAGTPISAGDKVVLYFGSANRDPARFPEPDRLDLGRTPNDHLAFGAGPHVCLGQHVARVEIAAVLREVLTRMQAIELDGPPEWLASSFIAGPRRMPVRFRPGPRTTA